MSLFTDDNQYQDTDCCEHADKVDGTFEKFKAIFIHVEYMFMARCPFFYIQQCRYKLLQFE